VTVVDLFTAPVRPDPNTALVVFVAGHPAPQGSKKIVGRPGGRALLVESSKRLKPWRQDVRDALLDETGQPRHRFGDAAVVVDLLFVMPRPASTPKRRTPPAIRKPDVDKLIRAIFDELTQSGCVADDARVVEVHARKRIAELDETPGCNIRVALADGQPATASPAVDLAVQQPRGATNGAGLVSPDGLDAPGATGGRS
jgi:crossover junction endodeoxyribonuclease RusA